MRMFPGGCGSRPPEPTTHLQRITASLWTISSSRLCSAHHHPATARSARDRCCDSSHSLRWKQMAFSHSPWVVDPASRSLVPRVYDDNAAEPPAGLQTPSPRSGDQGQLMRCGTNEGGRNPRRLTADGMLSRPFLSFFLCLPHHVALSRSRSESSPSPSRPAWTLHCAEASAPHPPNSSMQGRS
ncbi:hypothetical protein B0T11DRAFT_108574 [Plectosphaerella cucumerina]|uniref:Uncharacterized protein n=1 Tax=Plectosphaerella cucumerina TaxID=40658 RepID=A0A8K0TD86_9PEZI|nr:hypothetical protein B0T11DRAFT_108574 [Plectosphaerella cucumerina]